MSADNYNLVRKHPNGGYTYVMGFASEDRMPKATSKHLQFDTVLEAVFAAQDDPTEYGVTLHEEVRY